MVQNCKIIQENSVFYNLPLVGLLTLLIGKLLFENALVNLWRINE